MGCKGLNTKNISKTETFITFARYCFNGLTRV
jgi:hypothetical protein